MYDLCQCVGGGRLMVNGYMGLELESTIPCSPSLGFR